MAKISVQFHARREEISRLVASWVNELELWCAYECFTPAYQVGLVGRSGQGGEIQIPPMVSSIVLSVEPINMEVTLPYGLIYHNPNSLTVLLGMETSDVLGESVLQALTDDAKSLRNWKKIRGMLTSVLHKGAVVRNVITGSTERVHDHYYSAGAMELYTAGVRMAGPTDLLTFEFT
jgi:hypothetical protein